MQAMHGCCFQTILIILINGFTFHATTMERNLTAEFERSWWGDAVCVSLLTKTFSGRYEVRASEVGAEMEQ